MVLYGVRIRDGCVQLPQGFQVVQNIQKTPRENGHHVHAKRQQEEEEITVVPSPDAVVHPGAMMVKVLGTIHLAKEYWESNIICKHGPL